jgi:hypothetical protein
MSNDMPSGTISSGPHPWGNKSSRLVDRGFCRWIELTGSLQSRQKPKRKADHASDQIKELIGGRAWEHPSIFKVYGVTTAEEALHPTPERQKLYDEASAITHLTQEDPPLYMVYNEADGPLPPDARPGQGIHHPNFGRQLKKKMDSLGIENVFVFVPDAPRRNVAAEMLEFFQKQFAKVK